MHRVEHRQREKCVPCRAQYIALKLILSILSIREGPYNISLRRQINITKKETNNTELELLELLLVVLTVRTSPMSDPHSGRVCVNSVSYQTVKNVATCGQLPASQQTNQTRVPVMKLEPKNREIII